MAHGYWTATVPGYQTASLSIRSDPKNGQTGDDGSRDQPLRAAALAPPPRRYHLDPLTVVEVTTIDVTDHRFTARLSPAGKSSFMIRYFGFSPVGRKPPPEVDEEKLRALGYIQ